MTDNEQLAYEEGFEEGCSETHKKYENIINDYEKAHCTLHEQYDELRSDILESADENKKLSNRIDNIADEIASLISTIRDLQKENSSMEYENKILKRKLGIIDDSVT